MKIKKSGMIAACVAAALILWMAVIIYGNPFKVTDPSDLRFNPDKFSFRDYKTPEELAENIPKIFPLGTSKEYVERVLVRAGGVKRYGCSNPSNLCGYYYPWYMQGMKGGGKIQILFDKEDKLIAGAFHSINLSEALEIVEKKIGEVEKK